MRKFKISVDGKAFDVEVEEVSAEGGAVKEAPAVRNIAPVSVAAPKAAPVSSNGTKVVSPMPGMIKNLCVSEGATVKKDQVIYVLEAMKMDNDITSPCDGVISYKLAKGANVNTGDLVAVIS